MTFEQWWKENYEDHFIHMVAAMQNAFKEIARNTWEAAISQPQTEIPYHPAGDEPHEQQYAEYE